MDLVAISWWTHHKVNYFLSVFGACCYSARFFAEFDVLGHRQNHIHLTQILDLMYNLLCESIYTHRILYCAMPSDLAAKKMSRFSSHYFNLNTFPLVLNCSNWKSDTFNNKLFIFCRILCFFRSFQFVHFSHAIMRC